MVELRDGDALFRLCQKEAEAHTSWALAKIPLDLTDHELDRLASGLIKLAEDGHGSFLWANEDGEVRIEIVMAKKGETHWSVRLQAPPDFLHELRLVFVGQQDELADLARRVETL